MAEQVAAAPPERFQKDFVDWDSLAGVDFAAGQELEDFVAVVFVVEAAGSVRPRGVFSSRKSGNHR